MINNTALFLLTRRWVIGEFYILLLATPVFLFFAPRNILLYSLLALLFFGYVMLTTLGVLAEKNVTGNHLGAWGEMTIVTLPVVLIFLMFGFINDGAFSVAHVLLVFLIYFCWAFVQQTLFQYFLFNRLRFLFSGAPLMLLIFVNGILFGLVHAPLWDLVLLTSLAGWVWSFHFARYQSIAPLAMSHASLGVAYYFFIRQEDLWLRWQDMLTTLPV